MTTFPCIEDYMEFIAGYINTAGKKVQWFSPTSPLALANYDVGFVQSVSEQIQGGVAMSDRQAALAEKIIVTYARQLAKNGVEQPNHKNYKLGQRTVNRSSSLTRKDDLLYLRFPFNERMIANVKEFMKEGQGRVFWSKDDKAWCSAITEFNVSWLYAYSQANNIHVNEEVQTLFDAIVEAEKTPHKIELTMGNDGKLFISNAPDSLKDYVDQNIGYDNIYALVDSAGVLGFTISDDISEAISKEQDLSFLKLCAGCLIDFTPSKNKYSISSIIEWAKLIGRLPIIVYNPNFLVPDIDVYKEHFKEEEILIVPNRQSNSEPVVVDSSIKLVYTNTVLNDWQGRMPLLISYANLMHSVQKKEFMNKAEKVVYFCETLPRR